MLTPLPSRTNLDKPLVQLGIITQLILLEPVMEAPGIMIHILLECMMEAQETMEQPGAKLEAVGKKPTILPVLWEDM